MIPLGDDCRSTSFELDVQLSDLYCCVVTMLLVYSRRDNTFASVLLNGDTCSSLTNRGFSCPELMAVSVCTVDVESVMQTTALWSELHTAEEA